MLNLALANVAMLPLLALAGIVSGWWEALAWAAALAVVDWRIITRWRRTR